MARKAKVWFREQTGWYMTTIRGEQIKLSKDEKEAERAFHALMAKEEPEVRDTGVFPTFRKIADLFLADSLAHKKPTTYKMHKYFLQGFCDHVGRRRVNDLRVHHVTDWVAKPKDKVKQWNQSSACSARTTVLACLNWAVAQGYIDSHPLGKLKRGSHKKRERVLSPEERQLIRDSVKPDFRDFLFALEQTGARPFSEMALLTADMINWKARTITFREHKNEGKGKKRTIYMTAALIELLRRLADEHPTGYLFRNTRDHVWRSHDATRRLNYIIDKLKLPPATIYAWRHTYITEALERGMTANVVAELVGNSPLTIARNYDHLNQRTSTMLEAAQRAVS